MNLPIEQSTADILIVDDIPDNIRFLSSFLLECGYTVRKAINGQMALTAVKALAPDLILLDVNMPDVTGYDICRQLKADPATAGIPVIFLSAGSEAIDKVKAFQVGGVDYITKPFHLEEVLVRIQTQLTICNLQKDLTAQNEQLKTALSDLKIAQANLVQQEKMATLRKVVAGVAHEINNPLGFIACNIKPAQDYVNQLLELIDLYQRKYGEDDPEISDFLESIDLEFLTSDLVNILKSMGYGADRIHTVVLALRIFTRLDESGIKQINLHECIESVLALLHHRLEGRPDGIRIHIEKDYADLPLVTCYGDQLNQAIFNLLCNAIDAIDEKLQGDPTFTPRIVLRSQFDDPEGAEKTSVRIYIQDNGIGIASEHQGQIFEPFFTTKSAGHGVGLGLATCRSIVEEMHSGQLFYRSTAGEGSEFIVQLPIG